MPCSQINCRLVQKMHLTLRPDRGAPKSLSSAMTGCDLMRQCNPPLQDCAPPRCAALGLSNEAIPPNLKTIGRYFVINAANIRGCDRNCVVFRMLGSDADNHDKASSIRAAMDLGDKRNILARPSTTRLKHDATQFTRR